MKFRNVAGFPKYEISACGNVLISHYGKTPKIKGIRLNNDGYPRAVLYRDGKRYDLCIHTIQATTWIGEVLPGYEVDHIDDNILNSHYLNLQIITKRENCLKRLRRSGNTKLTFEMAEEIRELFKTGKRAIDLAKLYNVRTVTIYYIINYKQWKPSFHLEKK